MNASHRPFTGRWRRLCRVRPARAARGGGRRPRAARRRPGRLVRRRAAERLGRAVAVADAGASASRTTITQTSIMADVMRASRTVENEVIIAPAHVTASAMLHAYQLLATSGQEQTYALVAKNEHRQRRQARRQAPLPAAAGLPAQLRRQGPAHRVGRQAGAVLEGDLRQHQRRRPRRAVVRHGRRDGRRRGAGQGSGWPAHPGQARILKTTRPVPGGMSMVVRKDFCATDCARLTEWVNSARRRDPGRRQVPGRLGRRRQAVHLRRLARHHHARGAAGRDSASAPRRSPSWRARAS